MKKTLLFYSLLFFCLLVLQRTSGFIVKILLASAISPYDYGLITMVAITIPGMFQLFTNLNFFQILSHSTEGKKYFGFIVVSGLLLVTITSILLYIFNTEFFSYLNIPTDQADFFIVIIIVTLLMQSIIMDFQGLFTGMRKYSRPAMLMAVPTLIRLIAVAVLMVLNIYSLEIIILIFTLSSAVPVIIVFVSERYRSCLPLIKVIEVPSKTIFLFGWSVFFIGQFSSIILYLTRIVVSHEFGMVGQGYYDISLTIANLVLFVLGTLSFFAIPEATDSSSDAIYRKGGLSDVTRALFCLVILFSMIICFFSDYIVTKLFSAEYSLAGEYLPILIVGFIFLFVQTFLASIALSKADNTKDFFPLIAGGIVLLPVAYFLTEYLIVEFRNLGYGDGFIGGYISTSIVLIIWTIFTIALLKDRSPLKVLFHKGERLAISLVITSCLILFLNPNPLLGIVISVGVFSLLILVSGYLNLQMFRELVLNK
jgi:O-antigen/teichoic acid export membrane protein